MDIASVALKERLRLEKFDPSLEHSEIPFEVIELDTSDQPSKVIYRRPGAPPESYASGLSYDPDPELVHKYGGV